MINVIAPDGIYENELQKLPERETLGFQVDRLESVGVVVGDGDDGGCGDGEGGMA